MTNISLIAAVDEKNGLGKNNQLLCYLPADLKHFKTLTLGKPVIMGRNTFDSIGKPLPGRGNIVLTKKNLIIEGIVTMASLSEAFRWVAAEPEVMVIGGAQVYEHALPYASKIYLTVIHYAFKADVFFPTLKNTLWHCEDSVFRKHDKTNCYDMTFKTYQRIESTTI